MVFRKGYYTRKIVPKLGQLEVSLWASFALPAASLPHSPPQLLLTTDERKDQEGLGAALTPKWTFPHL